MIHPNPGHSPRWFSYECESESRVGCTEGNHKTPNSFNAAAAPQHRRNQTGRLNETLYFPIETYRGPRRPPHAPSLYLEICHSDFCVYSCFYCVALA